MATALIAPMPVDTPPSKLAGCWAHARRNFHEALEQSPQRASWISQQVQHLYRIESMLREQNAGPALRQAVRSHQSRPIVDRLKRALLAFKASRQHLSKSLPGEALDYALGPVDGFGAVPDRWPNRTRQ